MVLGLGAALTLVLVMLFGRFLWSWAVRAASSRQAKRVPVEMLELQADRDRLRAEHALMARKLELRLDDIKIRMAEQMAEVSRNRNRVQSLLKDLEQKDNALEAQVQENRDLRAQIDAHRVELDAAHRTVETLNSEQARHDADMSRLQGAFRKLNAKLVDRQGSMNDLSSELRTALRQEPAATEEPGSTPAERMRKRTAEITSLSADINRSSADDLLTGVFLPEAGKPAPTVGSVTARLQEKMDQTVSMNDDLKRELSEIDELIGKSASQEAKSNDPQPAKRTGTVANVISLAQRIRALQKGFDE